MAVRKERKKVFLFLINIFSYENTFYFRAAKEKNRAEKAAKKTTTSTAAKVIQLNFN